MIRIRQLEKQIWKARYDYYNETPTVSDKVYDAWVDELAELEPNNPAVTAIGSPIVTAWESFKHPIHLGSLYKCNTEDQFNKWYNDVRPSKVFGTLKLDGLTVSLHYENGILKTAATRGAGFEGENITPNVKLMKNVPLTLKDNLTASIRAEIMLTREDFVNFPDYKNMRNATSGICRRYDGKGSEFLSVYAYQLIVDQDIHTEEEQFKLLNDLNFTTPQYWIFNSAKEVIDFKKDFQTKKDDLNIIIDGLVFRDNDLIKQQSLGEVNFRPKGAIAYKFENEGRVTTILSIEDSVGNTGIISPIAYFTPIQLDGVEIKAASLHNYGIIKDLVLDIGAEVLVVRANQVIPKIEEVVTSTDTFYKAPTNCPVCNSSLINHGEYIKCINKDCPAVVKGKIQNWIKTHNIMEWGDKLIDQLCETNKVKTIYDLYNLSVADLQSLDRMGKKSAEKCYKELWANTSFTLDNFIGGLSITMVGRTTTKLLIKSGYSTIEQLYNLTEAKLSLVDGIGPVKAKSLVEGLKENKELITNLLTKVSIKQQVQGKLTNKSVCFTGSMNTKRDVLQKMASDAGAEVKNSVSRGLTYLVISDPSSTSTKAQTARKAFVKLISEEEFLAMI